MNLSSFTLKCIAAGTMLIDHIGLVFFPEELSWRLIGRLAFPLFAFLVAEGYNRTSNLSAYAKRLATFAALSQIPYVLVNLAAGLTPGLNIFFTLAAGLFALALFDRLPRHLSLPLIILLLFTAEFLGFDYGAYGVLTILASQLFIKKRTAGGAILLFLPLLYFSIIFFLPVSAIQVFAVMSFPLIAAYRGIPGPRLLPRYVFYWFYPLHLLILWLIWYYELHAFWSTPLS